MASLRGRSKSAVALFVDGYDIKLARMSLRGRRVVLEALRSSRLVTKLEERQHSEVMAEMGGPAELDFGTAAPEGLPEVSGAEDNNAVILELLTPYASSKYVLGYSIAEPSLYYHTVESDFGLKGKKLKMRIGQEIETTRSSSVPLDAIDFIPTAEGGLLSVVREDGQSLFAAIESVRPFLGKNFPRFTLIDSADTALMGLARANYGFYPDEISVIVYVGGEFSRLIFMKGTEYYHFAPVLGEGYDSPNIQNTIYSRLLLEQDSLGLARVDRVLIAGEAVRIGFDEFLREQLPEVEIQYLFTPQVDTSELPEEVQRQIPEYAIPIATAWKMLQDTHPGFYRINLIPDSIREGQRVFKLAWHGYLLLGLIFASTIFFTARIGDLNGKIKSRQSEYSMKQSQALVNVTLREEIDHLSAQLAGYNTALTVYESIVPGYDRWNNILRKISAGFAEINSVWITEMSHDREQAPLALKGFTLFRTRIPRVARLFDNTTLQSVEVAEIRGRTVYRFSVEIELPKETKK